MVNWLGWLVGVESVLLRVSSSEFRSALVRHPPIVWNLSHFKYDDVTAASTHPHSTLEMSGPNGENGAIRQEPDLAQVGCASFALRQDTKFALGFQGTRSWRTDR